VFDFGGLTAQGGKTTRLPELKHRMSDAEHHIQTASVDYTSQQDFVPRKVYYVSNVPFHAESKYAIKIFPSPTLFVQWNFLLLIFRNFSYFLR
jgi:hypothetical protein